MKCEDCRDRLKEYVEGNLPNDIDDKIEQHLLTCQECSRKYEEEKEEYELFNEAFMFRDVQFEDRTEKIMNSIDKTKYKSRSKNIFKYKKTFGVAAAILVCVIMIPAISKFSNIGRAGATADSSKAESALMPKSRNTEETASDEGLGATESKDGAASDILGIDGRERTVVYDKVIVSPAQISLEFNTPLITTDDGKFDATIEGRGTEGKEEGMGVIYVYDHDENVYYRFKSQDDTSSYSALNIAWYDDTHLMIVHGYQYGTLYNGEDIVMVDVTTGEQKIIDKADIDNGERFVGIERIKGSNTLKIHKVIYTDKNLNDYKEETQTIEDYNLWDDIK